MKTLETMTRDEINQLLFLETRAVDFGGRVNLVHMNDDDKKISEAWNKEGFVLFGRIKLKDHNKDGTHWCKLSDEAWTVVSEARKARANRGWDNHKYETTSGMERLLSIEASETEKTK